ncbi:MAG: ribonuclease PH [Phycisphaerae bacterium]|nr:ribonuclease PH [Phycisphaerae bacterium]
MRHDGRASDSLRPVKITRGYTHAPAGSVLIESGHTRVLCTASIDNDLPPWRKESGLGWVTAEYDMLPAATSTRRKRDRGGKIDGRSQEIQRLIGRSLRAVVDMAKLGPRAILIDCDVIQADGGTRTASITGAYVALVDAVRTLKARGLISEDPIIDSVSAVSVGLVGGKVLLDLCYDEDKDAEVDFNIVMTGGGRFVEVQGGAEAGTFTRVQMNQILALAEKGLAELFAAQRHSLAQKRRPGR